MGKKERKKINHDGKSSTSESVVRFSLLLSNEQKIKDINKIKTSREENRKERKKKRGRKGGRCSEIKGRG